MTKQIIVLGDIEMGGGTLTDDFISDKPLAALILKLSRCKNPEDLILNGDTFDFLKCPHITNEGHKTYPRHITEQVSVDKLKLIYTAHKRVFNALRVYVKNNKHRLFFIYGNHDPDLVYPRVQQEICGLLGKKQNILFKMSYKQHGIHVEHGHQYDLVSRMNFQELLLNYKGISILNVSWISLGIISDFLTLKEEHPFIERVKPWPVMFSLYNLIVKKLSWHSIKFLSKNLLYYPFRYYTDPTYDIPRTLLRELYYRLKNFNWEVEDVISSFKKTKTSYLPKNKLYVLGHVHKRYVEEHPAWTIIQPDSWRDEYILNPKKRLLYPKKKHFVKINVEENGRIVWKLIPWPVKRNILDFDRVIKDEVAAIRLAAKEEGYHFPTFTTSSR